MKKHMFLYAMVSACLLTAGCTHLSIGTGHEPPDLDFKGLGSALVRLRGIPDYNGNILEINLFRSGRHTGELLNASLWPLLDFDIGVIGARARVLILEAGVGTLFYYPDSSDDFDDDDDVKVIVVEEH